MQLILHGQLLSALSHEGVPASFRQARLEMGVWLRRQFGDYISL